MTIVFLVSSIFSDSLHGDICRIYADYLLAKKYYEDAALMYERGGLKLQAIDAWEKSLNWGYCIALSKV